MAHISILLDSPAVVSLIDGKLLAEWGWVGGLLYRVLYKGGSILWSNLLVPI